MDTTALLIDDHPLYREALVHTLQPLLGVAPRTAGSVEEALRLAPLPQLRLILLDLGLPGLRGAEAIDALQGAFADVPIIFLSASEDRLAAVSALRAGARAFLSKDISGDVLVETVRRLLAGEIIEPEWIMSYARGSLSTAPGSSLTRRQQDILGQLAYGYSNKEIGARLGISDITVKVHLSTLFKILGVVNRTQAVMAGRALGLISMQDMRTDTRV